MNNRYYWDIAAYDQADQLVLIVETKSRLNASPEWAARFRRNILVHGTLPNAPYFLMVFPDRLYLWKGTATNDEPIPPTYAVDVQSILQPYLERSSIVADHISGQSLELIITSWLNEVMHQPLDKVSEVHPWLVESGLYNALVGGSIGHQVLA